VPEHDGAQLHMKSRYLRRRRPEVTTFAAGERTADILGSRGPHVANMPPGTTRLADDADCDRWGERVVINSPVQG